MFPAFSKPNFIFPKVELKKSSVKKRAFPQFAIPFPNSHYAALQSDLHQNVHQK